MSNVHDYSTGELPGENDPQWDTQELQRDFDVKSFAAPYVFVVRKSDGVEGTLQFNHAPRIYFDFRPVSS